MNSEVQLPAGPSKPAAPIFNLTPERRRVFGVCFFLTVLVWAVFGQTLGFHNFLNYDDPVYVFDTPIVLKGLTLEGIRWAFTHTHCANWHPLTSISHMLDVQLFGLDAGGHHFTGVLLHNVTAILLFLALNSLTGCFWRSAFVAAIFAIHPLRAESVAWISERKDVLSGMFFMLTLQAYSQYVHREPRSGARYAWVAVFFALGLMCKPMLVTLPCVLLLLDYWPLGRFTVAAGDSRISVFRTLVLEKLPLFALTALSCGATVLAQSDAIIKLHNESLSCRVAVAMSAFVAYLRDMAMPVALVAYYPPEPDELTIFRTLGAILLLAGIFAAVFRFRKKMPWLLTGWLWYGGMLMPVIGLLQVGMQRRADRYTYLPQIGIAIALTWTVAYLTASLPHRRRVLGVTAAVTLGALSLAALNQVAYWHDSETLWKHTLALTRNNAIAHFGLGRAMLTERRYDEALGEFQKALKIDPLYHSAHECSEFALARQQRAGNSIARLERIVAANPDGFIGNYHLALELIRAGKVSEAILHLQRAVGLNRDATTPWRAIRSNIDSGPAQAQQKHEYAEAWKMLGRAQLQTGSADAAVDAFRECLALEPDQAEICDELGSALLKQGQIDEAIEQHRKAVSLDPKYAKAFNNLGFALLRLGKVQEAIIQFQKAVELHPGYAVAYNNLGNAFSQRGNMNEAVQAYRKAIESNRDYPEACANLGNALFRMNQLEPAIAQYRRAVELKPDYVKAQSNLATALIRTGRAAEAVLHLRKALEVEPQYLPALDSLAWILAASPEGALRDGPRAVELAGQANQLRSQNNPRILRTLAAAYAEVGRFADAVQSAERAVQLAESQGDAAQAGELHKHLELYRANKPFRDATLTASGVSHQ